MEGWRRELAFTCRAAGRFLLGDRSLVGRMPRPRASTARRPAAPRHRQAAARAGSTLMLATSSWSSSSADSQKAPKAVPARLGSRRPRPGTVQIGRKML